MGRMGNGHMVQEYYVERVREIGAERKSRLASLKNRRQALAYQRTVREAIRMAVGPTPPKTPLRATVTGVIERRGFRIEKLAYASRPAATTPPANRPTSIRTSASVSSDPGSSR